MLFTKSTWGLKSNRASDSWPYDLYKEHLGSKVASNSLPYDLYKHLGLKSDEKSFTTTHPV